MQQVGGKGWAKSSIRYPLRSLPRDGQHGYTLQSAVAPLYGKGPLYPSFLGSVTTGPDGAQHPATAVESCISEDAQEHSRLNIASAHHYNCFLCWRQLVFEK